MVNYGAVAWNILIINVGDIVGLPYQIRAFTQIHYNDHLDYVSHCVSSNEFLLV